MANVTVYQDKYNEVPNHQVVVLTDGQQYFDKEQARELAYQLLAATDEIETLQVSNETDKSKKGQ